MFLWVWWRSYPSSYLYLLLCSTLAGWLLRAASPASSCGLIVCTCECNTTSTVEYACLNKTLPIHSNQRVAAMKNKEEKKTTYSTTRIHRACVSATRIFFLAILCWLVYLLSSFFTFLPSPIIPCRSSF